MSSMWRRTMLYLGLAPDEEYDDVAAGAPSYQPPPQPEVEPELSRGPELVHEESVRPLNPEAAGPRGAAVAVRPVTTASEPAQAPSADLSTAPAVGSGHSSVRTIPARGKPNVVSPRSFNDAQYIADRFRADQIVIVNLQGADRDLARRLIDFCSGLCYGLAGQMEKVAHQVYLLTPRDAQLSEEERRRLQEQGLHR